MRTLIILSMLFLCCCNKPQITPNPIPNPNPTGTQKALIVGINTYPSAPLEGCVNDANDVKDYLIKNYGYKETEIRMLLDNKATTNAIKDGLDWLTKDAQAGDKRVFHYSGHGAEYPGETAGQPDNLNQIICPYDFDWSEPHMIMDVEFAKIFGKMPNNVIFNWISDSCHSGDLIKIIPTNTKVKITPRTYPNIPDEISIKIRKAKVANIKNKGFVNGTLDVGFVSGCRYDQTSADTQDETGRPCGALTHYFLLTLDKNKDSSLKDVVVLLQQTLARTGYQQVPQAEGARIDKAFQK